MMPAGIATQRRGEQLRRHILHVAKDVFLETGFERASMDTVATRAETSKRTLYAHFESKDKLFLAVLDLVRELYLGKLKTADVYASDPPEAVALFCARFLELMTWEPQVRTCRLSITEAERLPGSSSVYFDAMFTTTYQRLATYLVERYGTSATESEKLAEELLNNTVLPPLFRTLLNVQAVTKSAPDDATISTDIDVDAIRRNVSSALLHLELNQQ
jgi:AcrR family transcriptional regulator